jgi:hypothetical protein
MVVPAAATPPSVPSRSPPLRRPGRTGRVHRPRFGSKGMSPDSEVNRRPGRRRPKASKPVADRRRRPGHPPGHAPMSDPRRRVPNAQSITATVSTRRPNATSETSTCVFPHEQHRPRRGITAQRSPPGERPPGQPPATRRAPHPTPGQIRLDPPPVVLYHEHDALRHHREDPLVLRQEINGGVLARSGHPHPVATSTTPQASHHHSHVLTLNKPDPSTHHTTPHHNMPGRGICRVAGWKASVAGSGMGLTRHILGGWVEASSGSSPECPPSRNVPVDSVRELRDGGHTQCDFRQPTTLGAVYDGPAT